MKDFLVTCLMLLLIFILVGIGVSIGIGFIVFLIKFGLFFLKVIGIVFLILLFIGVLDWLFEKI